MTNAMTLREWFDQALQHAVPERDAFVATCADAHMRQQLERMLAAHARDGGLPVPSAPELANRLTGKDVLHGLAAGTHIGPFELLAVLGEGGSATVFHAVRQLEGVRQDVALKLLRRGLYTADAQRQFRRERLALAQLQHPGIAHLIEGGVTEAGLAYIALELVDGQPLTEFARERRLGISARLALFLQVCRAVEAAHRALIVHRDLKPSNVLVTADGRVKLLDFGIAKLLEGEDETQTRLPAFTPAYAAPEQKVGGPITTATDVYALGVLLGELLTGARLRGGHTPSREVGDDLEAGVLPAPPHSTRRLLRGDLDTIVTKALEEDPARRYASAGAFADDIERLLDGRPVMAHPPSRWYRARKFMVRHKGGVATTCAFLLAVLAALGAALWQAQVAREQARIARNESMRSNATRTFLVDLLRTASADLPKDERPTPEALVANAAQQARDDPDLDPLVRAQLLVTFSEIAHSNGDNDGAERFVDEAIERERALGIDVTAPEWIAALVAKGNLLHSTNRSKEADELMRDLLPSIEAVDTEGAVSALMLYGATRAYANDAPGAVDTAMRALAKAKRVFGADSTNGIETATYLGQICSTVHHYRESVTILDEAMARWRSQGRPLNEQYARSLFHLANARHRLGQREAAESAYREGIALMRRVHAAPFHRVAQGLRGYAEFLIDGDRFDEAQSALDEALSIDRAVFGSQDVRTATMLDVQAQLFAARLRFTEAEAAARDAHEVMLPLARNAGYELELARAGVHRANALLALGRPAEAAAMQAQSMPILEQQLGGKSLELVEGICVGGRIRLAEDAAGALVLAERALTMLEQLRVTAMSEETACRSLRAEALLSLSRSVEARAEVERALQRVRQQDAGAHFKQGQLLLLRARIERIDGDERARAATLEEIRSLRLDPVWLAAAEKAAMDPPSR
ncbi:serine/threonine-protein kinase [Dokdonella sp.]|uniref:serine/threonine-protein kinase n=1 Tax=Dokdonella sp. TaxID=2291710 RepID=UPI0025C2062E|nr:serine/threonine-protein kinase [Dokdonella sp.]MBX3688722.1 serine/threonine protein kinase [Dokdonella sp.]